MRKVPIIFPDIFVGYDWNDQATVQLYNTTLLPFTGVTKSIWSTYDGSDDQIVHVRLSRIFVGAFGWKQIHFSAWHGSQFIANLWLDNAFCPRESMFGKAAKSFLPLPTIVIAFLKETYFWDNFWLQRTMLPTLVTKHGFPNFGRDWCIRPKWWIPALEQITRRFGIRYL